MALRPLNQRVALTGSPEMLRQFGELGRAGEQAFSRIRSAANENRNIDLNLGRARQQLDEVGRAGEQAFTRIRRGADQAGQTVRQSVSQQSGFFSTLAGRITLVVGAITALSAGYLAAARSASQAIVDLGRQADAARLSITNFQNLRGSLQQLNLTEGEATQAADKLRDALNSAFNEGKAALERFGVRFLPVRQEIQKFGAEMEVFGTSFISGRTNAHALMQTIELLARTTKASSTTISDTTRALIAMRAVFDPLTGKVLEGTAAWIPFAEGVRRMKDASEQAALVNRIFGEGIGRTLLPAIRAGNDEFVRAFLSIQRLNLGFTDAQRKIGQELVNAWARLSLAMSQGRTEMGLVFAPLFTPGINAFADALRRNQVAISRFVEQLVNVARPAVEGFFRTLISFLDNPASFDRFRDGIVAVGAAVTQIFNGVVVPAFNGLMDVARRVATGINTALGTNISGAMVAIGAAVTALIGPFNAVLAAVLAVFGGQGPGFDAFREKLRSIGIDVEQLRTLIVDAVSAMLTEFRRLFTQLGENGGAAFFAEFRQAIVEFATSVPGIVLGVVAAVILLRRAFTSVAGIVNRIFGTQFTAGGLAAVAIAGSLSGAFTALAAILVAVSASLTIILTTLTIVGTVIAGIVGVSTAAGIAIAAGIGAALIAIVTYWDDIKAAAQSAWDFIVSGAKSLVGIISSALSSLVSAIVAPFKTAADIITGIWNGIIALIQRAINLGREQVTDGGGGSGFARGGWTGSGGIRQIAGFVHGQEYVEPAHVVRQPGVRAFLEVLRRNGGDLHAAISRFTRGFSVGGFVDNINASLSRNFQIPGYAGGGFVAPASSGRDSGFTLVLGQERFNVRAGDDTLDRLQRAAIRSQITSGGRKPGNY